MLQNIFSPENYMGYFWLVVAILCLFLELSVPGWLFFISFAFGALCSSVLAFMLYSVVTQCIIGLVVSLGSFLLMYRFLKNKKISDARYGNAATNVDALVGKKGIVVTAINKNEKGHVKIEGEVWSAVSEMGALPKGAVVTVLRVKGNSVIVREKNGNDK